MDSKEFALIRKRLGKTQKEVSEVLGTSVKAIHSYEQGWRSVPAHVERQLLFLLARRRGNTPQACWIVQGCKPERKRRCPAWEFQAGDMCWFISGTLCDDEGAVAWDEKMKRCRQCAVLDFENLLKM
ncbi:MAG: helix-turn-helix domain-containing protein [Desulfobacterales bacterium]|nr:helix-turn-helix domain-containing protein [Desulfobacterales bacterium]